LITDLSNAQELAHKHPFPNEISAEIRIWDWGCVCEGDQDHIIGRCPHWESTANPFGDRFFPGLRGCCHRQWAKQNEYQGKAQR
jgi:hypothetical protein